MNDKEKTIYSRQITLPEVGEAGQEELQEHGVLIVGMRRSVQSTRITQCDLSFSNLTA